MVENLRQWSRWVFLSGVLFLCLGESISAETSEWAVWICGLGLAVVMAGSAMFIAWTIWESWAGQERGRCWLVFSLMATSLFLEALAVGVGWLGVWPIGILVAFAGLAPVESAWKLTTGW